jgi:uncharacterized protein with GYD domain
MSHRRRVTWPSICSKRTIPPKGPRASRAKEAVTKVVESVGGKLEAFYYAFGHVDAYIILDLPDNVTAAAVSLTAHQSGFIAGKTVVLMSPDDMDKAAKKIVAFRPPGH